MNLPTYGNISLNAKQGCILNCLGMQPIFVENNIVREAFVGFVYRMVTGDYKAGKMKYMCKYYEDNNLILKNSFHISTANQTIVNFLEQNSFTLKHKGSLDALMENTDLLRETILFYLERIKYYITVGKGNFLITSRKDLYNTRLFTSNHVSGFLIYLVDESILPRNMIIIGHKNSNVFCSPFVACPLIDKLNFDRICRLNGIDITKWQIDTTKLLPLFEKHLNLYSLYQSYLDNVEVPYWFIETFNNPVKTRQKAYYTTLFFD